MVARFANCRILVLVPFLAAAAATATAATELPIAVSPGELSSSARVDRRCPTFSWAEVEGARAYELAVYDASTGDPDDRPLLRQRLDGAIYSWTPSLGHCLEPAGRYAWTVRAIGRQEAGPWAPPRFFDVAERPSESELAAALAVVEQYLRGRDRPPAAPASAGEEAAPPLADGAAIKPPEPVAGLVSMGDPTLQVNGSAVVTVATLAGALCGAIEIRFLDLGDGTVLDCNTGRQWLKDGSCLGTGTWDEGAAAGSVQAKVADLNDTGTGSDFGCQDYTEGSYTDWRVPVMTELCGLWPTNCAGGGCCTASEGLIDDAFTSPALGNAAGDGQWSADDAFVDVPGDSWSATSFNATDAWFADHNFATPVAGPKTMFSSHVWPVRD